MNKIEIDAERGTFNVSEDEVNRAILLDRIGDVANAEKDGEERIVLDQLAGWLARARFVE